MAKERSQPAGPHHAGKSAFTLVPPATEVHRALLARPGLLLPPVTSLLRVTETGCQRPGHVALFHRLSVFHPLCHAEGLAMGLEVLQGRWAWCWVAPHLCPSVFATWSWHFRSASPPNPSGGAAGLCFHPCAASKHCFSHAWAALLPAVLPDNTGQVWARLGQAWGSHCALLLVYSLTEPENFARCPVPCTMHGSHLLERGTNTFSYKEPWRPSTLLQMLAIAAILEVSTRCCWQKLALQVHRCVLRGASPAGIHKVPSGNIYQIRPSAKIWNDLVSWSQQGLAGSKAA